MTNLFREHTEWHGSEQAYRREKLRLLSLPEVRVAVLNAREPLLDATHATDAKVLLLRRRRRLGRGAGRVSAGRASWCSPPEQLPLPGEHNALNLCAALDRARSARHPNRRCPAALGGLPAARPPAAGGRRGRRGHVGQRQHLDHPGVDDRGARELPGARAGADRGRPGPRPGLRRPGVRAGAPGATVIGVPSTGGRVVAAARGGRTHRERARRGGRPRAGRRHRPRAVPSPGRSCCCHRRLPASTTTATSSSAASASGSCVRGHAGGRG